MPIFWRRFDFHVCMCIACVLYVYCNVCSLMAVQQRNQDDRMKRQQPSIYFKDSQTIIHTQWCRFCFFFLFYESPPYMCMKHICGLRTTTSKTTSECACVCVYVCVCVCIYIYIYIVYVCVYVYLKIVNYHSINIV